MSALDRFFLTSLEQRDELRREMVESWRAQRRRAFGHPSDAVVFLLALAEEIDRLDDHSRSIVTEVVEAPDELQKLRKQIAQRLADRKVLGLRVVTS